MEYERISIHLFNCTLKNLLAIRLLRISHSICHSNLFYSFVLDRINFHIFFLIKNAFGEFGVISNDLRAFYLPKDHFLR